jgi:hypothetical protein
VQLWLNIFHHFYNISNLISSNVSFISNKECVIFKKRRGDATRRVGGTLAPLPRAELERPLIADTSITIVIRPYLLRWERREETIKTYIVKPSKTLLDVRECAFDCVQYASGPITIGGLM